MAWNSNDCSTKCRVISYDVDVNKEANNNRPLKSNHYETYMKINSLNLLYGWMVGLKTDSMWKYNNATRWTKFMLIFGTTITVYSHLLIITKPTKLIQVFSLFGIIAPVSFDCKFQVFPNNTHVHVHYEGIRKIQFICENIFKGNGIH